MFADIAASALTAGREWALSLMTDECVVRRLVGVTTDPETGHDVEDWEQVYPAPDDPDAVGVAKSQTSAAQEGTVDAAGREFTAQRYRADFPVGSFVPQVGDVIEWTACEHDPHLVGVRERITALLNKSHATAQRVATARGVL